MSGNDREDAALREMVMRYRVLEEETSDPIAVRFLHDIVADLEAQLGNQRAATTCSSRTWRMSLPLRQTTEASACAARHAVSLVDAV